MCTTRTRVERGRAGWAMSPDIFKGEPVFLAKANPWERFRIGQSVGSWSTDPAQRKLMRTCSSGRGLRQFREAGGAALDDDGRGDHPRPISRSLIACVPA